MEVDHIIPESLGGPTKEDNLWLACAACNEFKGNRIAGVDSLTGDLVRLFDPRRQVWREHFVWANEGATILGSSPSGRATVESLHLNRPSLVLERRRWVSVGWHPPQDSVKDEAP